MIYVLGYVLCGGITAGLVAAIGKYAELDMEDLIPPTVLSMLFWPLTLGLLGAAGVALVSYKLIMKGIKLCSNKFSRQP